MSQYETPTLGTRLARRNALGIALVNRSEDRAGWSKCDAKEVTELLARETPENKIQIRVMEDANGARVETK